MPISFLGHFSALESRPCHVFPEGLVDGLVGFFGSFCLSFEPVNYVMVQREGDVLPVGLLEHPAFGLGPFRLGHLGHHFLLLIACIILTSVLVVLTWFRDPTTFEVLLFQLGILVTGLLGSYIFGRDSAVAMARDLVRPHARSAFRRVTALYESLFRLSNRIEELKGGESDHQLDLVQALVNEQIRTGRDAMEDWRDIIPEEVEQVERRMAGNDQST